MSKVNSSATRTSGSAATAKSSTVGTFGGATKAKPSTVGTSGGATKAKPSTVGTSSGATKSKSSIVGTSGGAAESKISTTGTSGGAPESKISITGTSYGAAKAKPSTVGTSGGATEAKPSTVGTSSGATKSKSSIVGTSDGAAKAKQAAAQFIGAVERRRINKQMAQNILLIWLDNNIDDNIDDCRNTIAQLRHVVNTINTYTDGEECIQFLENMGNDKACVVISGSLGQHIVPRVHDMSQVDSIFIFCSDKIHNEQWANEWSKIKGVFTEIAPICEAVKQAAQQCEQNAISISFMATSGNVSKKNLDQLDPCFMYTQILKEILLTITFEPKHFAEYIEYCRDVFFENDVELKNVENFEKKYYGDKTPIWWYTLPCFLYPMLNHALRLMNVNIIIKMGFFIGDLHRQIEQLHKEQFSGQNSSKSLTVYRGQGMSKNEFKQMTETKGGLMSFNNFLSTSKNPKVSLGFAQDAVRNPDLVGILFVMTIDPSKSTTAFASIVDVSYFKDQEDEVLFAMHTVFRIGDITPMGENPRLFRVELTLTDDNDKDLRRLTDCIREETFPEIEGWKRLCLVLPKMNQPQKTEQVCEILLQQETEEFRKAPIYNQLGWAKYEGGEYQEAIRFYEKSLAIYEQSLPPNHPDLATCCNNLGVAYYENGYPVRALSYYEKALAIREQSLPPNHSDFADSYLSIGNVYGKMGSYPKTVSYYEKALAIQQQSLPPTHPHLACSYNNIGEVYRRMGDYPKALSSHEKALAIRQQSLPSNHPDLAMSHYNMGLLYDNMSKNSKACSSYERAVEIGQKSLPSNHPLLQKYQEKLVNIKTKL